MIGSYEDWQNMAVKMRTERDEALDEVDRLKQELAEAKHSASLSRDYLHASENIYSGLNQALETENQLLKDEVVRWKGLALAPVELVDEDHQETWERAEKAESLLEQANALLLRWCTAFSMGPLADQYLRQESKKFLIGNYAKHNFHVESKP